jgi:hypothetical protein
MHHSSILIGRMRRTTSRARPDFQPITPRQQSTGYPIPPGAPSAASRGWVGRCKPSPSNSPHKDCVLSTKASQLHHPQLCPLDRSTRLHRLRSGETRMNPRQQPFTGCPIHTRLLADGWGRCQPSPNNPASPLNQSIAASPPQLCHLDRSIAASPRCAAERPA